MRKLLGISIVTLLSFSIFGSSFNKVQATDTPTEPEEVTITKKLTKRQQEQIQCLADNIYFEAKGEPELGQRAVAFVTMNRVNHSKYPSTVCAVVKQKTTSTCQFSWWCSSKTKNQAINRQFDLDLYRKVREIAEDVYLRYNSSSDVTNGALFYHATYVPKSALGMKNLKVTARIGRHIFYKKTTM